VINTFYRKWIILGILFLLPVIFLLFLYPSTHNYNTLDIVNEDIKELEILNFIDQNETTLEENITILNFLGNKPLENITGAMNLKELVYDKFKGFKKFQIVTIGSADSENSLKNVKKELIKSDELKYWFFATASDEKIKEMINVNKPVIFDCLVDKEENCFPMIPSGKPHNQMLLGPNDQKENKITGKGKTLV